MGRKKINLEGFVPRGAKWLNMKIIVKVGTANNLIKALPTLTPKYVKLDNLAVNEDNIISFSLRTTKPDLFMLMLKTARHSIANGIMFKAVFKDLKNTIDWCGYYETNPTSTIEGSRYTNKERLNQMVRTYFP